MGKAHAAVATAAAAVLAGSMAAAQPSPQPSPRYTRQPLNLRREQLGSERFKGVAHTRMSGGDCAGALDAFDAALRSGSDPVLHRDRGLCHEKLGHPYPAIDDYRIYLTSMPDAPDAQRIGARLRHLEDETSGRTSSSSPDSDEPTAEAASATVTVGTGGVQPGATGMDDKAVSIDGDDESRSSLRRGRGWAFAPFFSEHKWFSDHASFGDSQTWAECVGLQVRYSIGVGGGLVVEAGYEHFNSTSIDVAVASGLTSQIAYELRLPFTARYDDQLTFAPGLGYEYVMRSPNAPQAASSWASVVVPRARLGYRHMIQASAALDLSIDGGAALGSVPYDSPASVTVLAAVNVAVLWGF